MAFFSINRTRRAIARDLSDTDASTKFEVTSELNGEWHVYITQVFGNPDFVTVDVVEMLQDGEQEEYDDLCIRSRSTFDNDLDFHIFVGQLLGMIAQQQEAK